MARTRRAAFAEQEYWGKPVPGFGDPDARLVVVGLAPAAHGANRTGRMFTGDRSGDWLYRALWRAGFANQPNSTSADDGLVLSDAFITAPVKCAPPANKPTAAEQAACLGFFQRELTALRSLQVIVALGGLAYVTLARHFGVRPRPPFSHGLKVQPSNSQATPDPPVLLCSYHVSQQNTFTGRLTEEMLDAVFSQALGLLR